MVNALKVSSGFITAEEAGKMVDYLDRRKEEFEKKRQELDAEIALNRDLRDRYFKLWLDLTREIEKK